MKGDFSRNSFRADQNYSRVMMQQGRVQLDADWNEQNAILLGYLRTLTRDLFGPAAGPAAECGFRIVSAEMRGNLPKEIADQVEAALKAEKTELGDDDLMILPGRYYVGGLPVAATAPLRYRAQTGFPFGAPPVDSLRQHSWLAYLDVWEDFVSADQDPYIRDVALGGIDTCGRAVVRWQVRLLLDPKNRDDFDAMTATGTGRIKAQANPSEKDDMLCSIAPDARYRGLENQLYRVEIHAGGAAQEKGDGGTFKWSRDNGAVTFPIRQASGNRITLAHLGRDEATTLIEGDWVELVDDAGFAAAGAGILAQVGSVDRDDLRVDLRLPDGAPALPSFTAAEASARHALLRRWDHKGSPKQAGGAIAIVEGAGHAIELEDGIKVTFEAGGTYRAGDYWMIPARVATGDVEWPGAPDDPAFQLPHGPHHHYAPLLLRTLSPAGQANFEDLRCQIERLPCMAVAKAKAQATETVTPAPKATAVPQTGTTASEKLATGKPK